MLTELEDRIKKFPFSPMEKAFPQKALLLSSGLLTVNGSWENGATVFCDVSNEKVPLFHYIASRPHTSMLLWLNSVGYTQGKEGGRAFDGGHQGFSGGGVQEWEGARGQ